MDTVKAKRHALVQRREILGHSQETLAQELGVELTTVGRWERGETSPQPWARPKLADALAVSLEELDRLLAEGQPPKAVSTPDTLDEPANDPEHDPVLSAPWSQRGTVKVAVMLRGGDRPVERRGFLAWTGTTLTAPAHQWLVHEPGPLVSGLSGRRVSAGLADRLPAMIAELRTMDDAAGGGSMLSLAQHQFGWVAGLLDRASYDESTGRKLHLALAELGQLAGWGAYDAGQPGLAQRYYVASLRAAHTADDRPLGAYTLGYLAYQATRQGRPAEAVTLIETALAGVRGRETPALLAELYSKQADAFATLSETVDCTTAMSKARNQIEHLSPDDDLSFLYWVTPAEVTAYAGQCLLQLGRADQETVLLDDGIALFEESFVRNRQAYVIHLADALSRPGEQRDLDAAAGRGMEAIHIAESLDSTYSIDLLRNLYRQMQPHTAVHAVRDFLDQAQALVQGIGVWSFLWRVDVASREELLRLRSPARNRQSAADPQQIATMVVGR
ncbi:MAG: helix-turn-helix transcriptional regulator [Pseudonocardiaceae bacterium]